jgi:hypothetical protein
MNLTLKNKDKKIGEVISLQMFAVFLVFLDVTDSVFKRVWRLNNKDTGCSYIWNEFSFKDFTG